LYAYEEGFWHLIERKDKVTQVRVFDPRRAERLSWFKLSIDNSQSQEIICFNYVEGNGRINT
jgi:hypothetical protein